MRTLAVDLGERRVGLALSDAGGKLATPFDVISVDGAADAIEPVAKILDREGVERIVIGLPLNMDGTAGPAAMQAIEWGKQIGACTTAKVVFVDERLSSFAAEQRLADRKRIGEKLTRKRKKEQQDAIAAADFLQAFLDGQLKAMNLP